MRTLAGGFEVKEFCYVEPRETPPRIPAPVDEIEAFLAANTFHCEAYAARITPEQCQTNRDSQLYFCCKCTQDKPCVSKKTKRRGRSRTAQERYTRSYPVAHTPPENEGGGYLHHPKKIRPHSRAGRANRAIRRK
jgi:hypothetical protein